MYANYGWEKYNIPEKVLNNTHVSQPVCRELLLSAP
jgi:hypothetical protein